MLSTGRGADEWAPHTLLIEHLLRAGPLTDRLCSVSAWPISCVVITYANEAAVTPPACRSWGCPESRTDRTWVQMVCRERLQEAA